MLEHSFAWYISSRIKAAVIFFSCGCLTALACLWWSVLMLCRMMMLLTQQLRTTRRRKRPKPQERDERMKKNPKQLPKPNRPLWSAQRLPWARQAKVIRHRWNARLRKLRKTRRKSLFAKVCTKGMVFGAWSSIRKKSSEWLASKLNLFKLVACLRHSSPKHHSKLKRMWAWVFPFKSSSGEATWKVLRRWLGRNRSPLA